MNSDALEAIVAQYFRDLEEALRPLPAPERRPLLNDIRDHVAEARAGLSEETELAVREILERVGLPDEIAGAAIGGEAPQLHATSHHLRRTRHLLSRKSIARVGVPIAVLVGLAPVLAIVLLSSPPAAPSHSTGSPATVPIARAIALVSSSATSANYSVPAASYSVLVTTANPCYVEIKAPPREVGSEYAEVVRPSAHPSQIPEQGAISVTLEAQATSLGILAGGRSLGAIEHPKLGFTYTFRPST